jgi:beta-glucanase (GH16 family)/regulation of enolase protein 1 (concanavalin A-like superfamily)
MVPFLSWKTNRRARPTTAKATRRERCRFRRLELEQLEGRVLLNAPGTGWQLAFVDEFNGNSIDTSKWTTHLAWPGDDGSYRHHNSNYLSYIMDDDVIVSNGTLELRTEKRDVQNPSGKVYHYTEGMIQTSGKFSTAYGYAEIRAKVPVGMGPGLWPAFWMLDDGWPPEMDIGEWWTSNNRFHQGLAHGPGVQWDDYNTYTPLPGGFHTYGLLWSPGQQVYYVDGIPRWTINANYVRSQSMYLILNSGVDALNPPNGNTVFPNDFEVDYVRVYTDKGPGATIVNPGFEQGSDGWALSGSAKVVNYNQRTGSGVLRLDGPSGEADQVITGLTPNTTYTLGGWDRVSYPSAEARIGVRNYGVWASTNSTSYTNGTLTFTTGPTSTQATIYCSKPVNGNAAEFDDLYLLLTPTLSAVPDRTTNVGTPTGWIPFTVGNAGGAPGAWALSATSDNPALVPNANLVFGGNGVNRTLQVTPVPDMLGTANITLTVTDPYGGSSSETFAVNVVNSQLPSPWWNQDIGVVGYSGSASTDGTTYTVTGSGADIWNQSDNFQYVYQPVTGDGSIVARVVSQDNTDGYAKAGVMIRETLDPTSAHALVDLTPSHGAEFIRRTATGAYAVDTFDSAASAPYWVRLVRSGDTFTAYDSADGLNWNLVDSATIPMAQSVYAGLAVCSHNNSLLNNSTFDNVSLSWANPTLSPIPDQTTNIGTPTGSTPFTVTGRTGVWTLGAVSDNPALVPNENITFGGSGSQRTLQITPAPGQLGTANVTVTVTDPISGGSSSETFAVNVVNCQLPSPWWNQDIGVVGYSGGASTDGTMYTVTGSGADIWNQSDGFQYAYQPLSGDGTIIARVTNVDNTGYWAKAGVMIRETLDPGSTHALVDLTPNAKVEFIRRTSTEAWATSTVVTADVAPYWVRLKRSGNTFTASKSADGVNWTSLGSAVIPMAQSVYVGLAVCAFNNTALNNATFDNVSITSGTAPSSAAAPGAATAAEVSTSPLAHGTSPKSLAVNSPAAVEQPAGSVVPAEMPTREVWIALVDASATRTAVPFPPRGDGAVIVAVSPDRDTRAQAALAWNGQTPARRDDAPRSREADPRPIRKGNIVDFGSISPAPEAP